MFTQFFAAHFEIRDAATSENVENPTQQKGRLITFVGVLLTALTVFASGSIIVTRTNIPRRIPDLPQPYRPGSPLPSELSCGVLADGQIPPCFLVFEGHKVYFDFDVDTRMILNSIIPVENYNLGELILSWGSPTTIRWTDYTIYIYWGSRAAVLDSDSIQPDSEVQSILYSWYRQNESPWRGFQRRRD